MHCARFVCALLGAHVAAAGAAPGSLVLPFAAGRAAFEQALVPRAFEFPRDHGPHLSFAHEWWYFTGHLAGPSGERFGFEVTFFRVALAPADAPDAHHLASRWRARQFYVAHFAVTDIDRGRFRFAQRAQREALGLSGADASGLRIWIDDWSAQDAGGTWQVRAAAQGYALDLKMTPDASPVANGEHGLSQKSSTPSDASYYYSIPRLAVRGRLTRDGKALAVSGRAWLDREWGSGALGADEAGWDWFALQLSDGSTLMLYSLRRRDGRQDVHSAGTWVGADGRVRTLTSADIGIAVTDFWASPRGGRYPARWTVKVPALNLSVDLRPLLADQELDVQPRYWEGAVEIAGTAANKPVAGEGYVELVGYAQGR